MGTLSWKQGVWLFAGAGLLNRHRLLPIQSRRLGWSARWIRNAIAEASNKSNTNLFRKCYRGESERSYKPVALDNVLFLGCG